MGLDIDATHRLPLGLEAELHALFMGARFSDGTIVDDSRMGVGPTDDDLVDIGGKWLPRVSPLTVHWTLSRVLYTGAGAFDRMIRAQTRMTHYMTAYDGDGGGELLEPPTRESFPVAPPPSRIRRRASRPARPTRFSEVPTHTRVDFGAGGKHSDGRISSHGFVNNVFNVAYPTNIISTPGLNLRFCNPPRAAGIRFREDW